ncbi:NAD(P)-binding protein [Aspergillus sclerotioniger CBS 115572]|uniref:NAD(P)-binding protein n=1 Tax=Aspergillus sclerotioniger CBS 115572 TaxID=1450535 RepID=A0A317XGL5_9EURO|nr:NAD(P)-binding protein [Aspergillus sclerotioniger CBS 115572]PWY96468.1 NAD(P)-binding protein [Aspergillus sclerotioniger CBS 115572]
MLPLPDLGPTDVLVIYHARSMNYPKVSTIIVANETFPWKCPDRVVVPGSDGASEMIGTGCRGSRFTVGDRVMLQHYPGFHDGPAPPADQKVPGTHMDGTFREHGVWEESALHPMPEYLSYEEAATLPCSALTAGSVLTQGTGGVPLFAIQLALKMGATVIATTSSEEGAARLRALGAHHKVFEIGGPGTSEQSFKCVSCGGKIDIVGFVTGRCYKEGLNLLSPLLYVYTVRGIEVGTQLEFKDMVRYMEAWKIRPVLDERRFALQDMKQAYRYFWEGKHFGKMVITYNQELDSVYRSQAATSRDHQLI